MPYWANVSDITWARIFTINHMRLVIPQLKGAKYGYRVNMKIEIPDEYDFAEFYLFIHNQLLPPVDFFSSHGFWIMPGSWNYFEIERVFHQKLEAPYSNCLQM